MEENRCMRHGVETSPHLAATCDLHWFSKRDCTATSLVRGRVRVVDVAALQPGGGLGSAHESQGGGKEGGVAGVSWGSMMFPGVSKKSETTFVKHN